MSRIRVSVEGHYEVQELPYGKDYVWKPGRTVIECNCGRMMNADAEHTVCPGCGSDHAPVVREVVGRRLADEVLHPWHPEYEEWMRHRKIEEPLYEFNEIE